LGEVYELLGQMEDALQCFEQIRDHTTPRGSAADHIEGIRRKMLQEGGPDESDQS